MRTRIWHSDWKPRWLIRYVSAALLSFMDKQVSLCRGDILAQISRAFADDGGGLGEGGEIAVGPRGPIADAPLDIVGALLAREARSDLAPFGFPD